MMADDQEVGHDQGVGSFKIPHLRLITAFILALIALGGWSLALERAKADKMDLRDTKQEISDTVRALRDDIMGLRADMRSLSEALRARR